jgi:SAM-dependent methyltransferase
VKRAHAAPERLDQPDHDPATLAHSLAQVAQVNRWLGGTRAVLRVLEETLPRGRPVRILDVGCGDGDLPTSILAWCRRTGRDATLVAADLHPQILQLAADRLGDEPAAHCARLDARMLPFDGGAFDVALMSLTLHHFEGDEPVRVLRELARVSHRVVVNDLERGRPNLIGATLLAHTLWRTNPLTRHDGPLSVRRAFTRAELAALADAAGLDDVVVRRRFFYRLVLTAGRARAAAAATDAK